VASGSRVPGWDGVIVVELPTGTVTLLFTDIEGSTRMLRSLGDDDGAVLRAHRAILREAVRRHGGVEFGTEGDAGPGGTGKTRLALEVPRALAARFPDGMWFVPLATVTDPALVGLAVVGSLRLANPSGRAWIDVVADRLRDWAALLVLDNFEHVAEAGPFVAELLARAPGSRCWPPRGSCPG
jgi:class 3 adenylate cyclase